MLLVNLWKSLCLCRNSEHHVHLVVLYTVWYNWTRIHKRLGVSPAMAAGLADRLWDCARLPR